MCVCICYIRLYVCRSLLFLLACFTYRAVCYRGLHYKGLPIGVYECFHILVCLGFPGFRVRFLAFKLKLEFPGVPGKGKRRVPGLRASGSNKKGRT